MALLANMTLSGVQRQAREVLVECFWPDRDPASGLSNLSSALWRLRRDLAQIDEPVLADRLHGETGLSDKASFWLDVEAFRTKARSVLANSEPLDSASTIELEQALNLYRGDLLEGFYYDWVLQERECLRALYVRGRLRQVEHYAEGLDWERAIECCRDVLRLDPLRENVQRRLIELYALNGELAAARRQYDRLVQLLADELQVAPAPETTAALHAAEKSRLGSGPSQWCDHNELPTLRKR